MEKECVSVCVCVRERERERKIVWVIARKKVWMCLRRMIYSEIEKGKGREGGSKSAWDMLCVCVCEKEKVWIWEKVFWRSLWENWICSLKKSHNLFLTGSTNLDRKNIFSFFKQSKAWPFQIKQQNFLTVKPGFLNSLLNNMRYNCYFLSHWSAFSNSLFQIEQK